MIRKLLGNFVADCLGGIAARHPKPPNPQELMQFLEETNRLNLEPGGINQFCQAEFNNWKQSKKIKMDQLKKQLQSNIEDS